MVPLSPFNDTLVMVAEWVGDTGLLAVSGDEILYMVGCELKVLPLSFKIENERQTKQYTFFCLLCYCYWYHVDPLFCSGLFTARSKSFDSTIYLIRTRLREWGNSRKFLVYTNFLIQIENHRILVVETSTIFYVWFYPNQADLEFAILSIKTPITLRSICPNIWWKCILFYLWSRTLNPAPSSGWQGGGRAVSQTGCIKVSWKIGHYKKGTKLIFDSRDNSGGWQFTLVVTGPLTCGLSQLSLPWFKSWWG